MKQIIYFWHTLHSIPQILIYLALLAAAFAIYMAYRKSHKPWLWLLMLPTGIAGFLLSAVSIAQLAMNTLPLTGPLDSLQTFFISGPALILFFLLICWMIGECLLSKKTP